MCYALHLSHLHLTDPSFHQFLPTTTPSLKAKSLLQLLILLLKLSDGEYLLPDLVLGIANQLLPHSLFGILASEPLSEFDPINFLQELTLGHACEPHLVKFFLGETLEKGV